MKNLIDPWQSELKNITVTCPDCGLSKINPGNGERTFIIERCMLCGVGGVITVYSGTQPESIDDIDESKKLFALTFKGKKIVH
jgi:endogenous inhibitor of DNA gyrase (YacG/DUF329 family)